MALLQCWPINIALLSLNKAALCTVLLLSTVTMPTGVVLQYIALEYTGIVQSMR